MKKMVMIAAMMLLGLTSVFAGDAQVSIASTHALTDGTFPTSGAAFGLTVGDDKIGLVVVQDLVVNNNSEDGWTLNLTGTGTGVLTCADHAQTIPYTLEMAFTSGTLGSGLVLAPALGSDIAFVAGAATVVAGTASATTPTVDYTFNLVMDILATDHDDNLMGTYTETLTITLAAD